MKSIERTAWRIGHCFKCLSLMTLCLMGFGRQVFGHPANNINCVALLPDGSVLVGGKFTMFGKQGHTNLARLTADGHVDDTFSVSVDSAWTSQVDSLAVQSDGKVIVAGTFAQIAGFAVPGFARLNVDGRFDSSFKPAVIGDGGGRRPAVQPDDKVLVISKSMGRLVRLNVDGSKDETFSVTGSASGPAVLTDVQCFLVQPDGKIVVGGQFLVGEGQPRNNLGRLNSDGSVDGSFNPVCDGPVSSLVLDAENRIVVAGNFSSLAGYQVGRLGRLNDSGMLDLTFTNRLAGVVNCLSAQSDGKFIVGGNFWNWGQNRMQNIERFNADGSWDNTFIPLAFEVVNALAIEPNGDVLIGGVINEADFQSHIYLQDFAAAEPATQNLFYDGLDITWLREGVGPVVCRTFFEISTNGSDWESLGEGTRIANGWQLRGVSMVPGQLFRARGWASGYGWTWHEPETVVKGPVIVIPPADYANFSETPFTVTAWVAAGASCSYQWNKDGNPLPGATNRSLFIPSLQLADAGAYTITVSNVYGGQTSRTARLKVLRRPGISVGGTLGLRGGRMTFDVTGTAGQKVVIEKSADLYEWAALVTNTMGTPGLHFIDPKPNQFPVQFYRLRALQ